MTTTHRPKSTILFEIDLNHYDNSPWWKPGWCSTPLGKGRFRRFWWLWFSISLVTMSIPEFVTHARKYGRLSDGSGTKAKDLRKDD